MTINNHEATIPPKTRTVACIPSYNEQETISDVIKKTLQHVEKIYLVDDASTDKTTELAKAQGAQVIKHEQRKGLGQTLHELIEVSIKDNPDIIVILEGDNPIYPELVSDFLQPVLDREADIVFGLVKESLPTQKSGESAETEGIEYTSSLAIRVLTHAAANAFLELDNNLLGELEQEYDHAKKKNLTANVLTIEIDSEDSTTKDAPEPTPAPEAAILTEPPRNPPHQTAPPPKTPPAFKFGIQVLAALTLIAVLSGAFLVFNSGILSKPEYTLAIQPPEGSGSMSLAAGTYALTPGNSSRIEAIASLGWSFDYWIMNNSTTNYTNPITIQMDENLLLRAKFSQVKNVLTIGCVGSGSTNPGVGAYAYEINSTTQVTVTPKVGWQLIGWTLDGDSVTSGNPYTITMESDHMLVAILSPIQYKLDIETLGGGRVNRTPDSPTYTYGSDVLLTTTPNNGWIFDSWSGDASSSNDTISVTITGDKHVTANFTQPPEQSDDHTLTIESPEGNGITTPLNGAYTYTNGSRVEVEATADEGWQFDHWIIDGQYMDYTNPVNLTMSANHLIKPTFMETGSPPPQTYPLIVNTIGSGTGSVTLSPSGGNYPAGTVVTLTAIPAADSSFTNWGGDLSSTLNPATITMDSAKTVTADFTLNQFTVSLVQIGQGTATASPSGPYVYGSTIDLTASESESGWVFAGWSSDPTISLSNPLSPTTTATVYGSGTVSATFTQTMYPLSISTVGTGTGSIVISPAGGSYASGTVVTLEATQGAGSTFTTWGGDLSGSTNPTTITIDSAKSVTAEFTLIEYTITTSASPGGSVSVSPIQSTYHYGDSVTLTANPDSGYSFANWSGDITGSENPYTLSVDGDLSATANFNLD